MLVLHVTFEQNININGVHIYIDLIKGIETYTPRVIIYDLKGWKIYM